MFVHSIANGDMYAKSFIGILPKYKYAHLISINGIDEPTLTDEQIEKLIKHNIHIENSYVFDDINYYNLSEDDKEYIAKKGYIICDAKMAKGLADDISNFMVSDADLLVVHCHAGISRSGATAAVAAFLAGWKCNDFVMNNKHIYPNKYIADLILKELGLDVDDFDKWLKS